MIYQSSRYRDIEIQGGRSHSFLNFFECSKAKRNIIPLTTPSPDKELPSVRVSIGLVVQAARHFFSFINVHDSPHCFLLEIYNSCFSFGPITDLHPQAFDPPVTRLLCDLNYVASFFFPAKVSDSEYIVGEGEGERKDYTIKDPTAKVYS